MPGKNDDHDTQDKATGGDQTKPPPEVNENALLYWLCLFVERLFYRCHMALQVLTPGPEFIFSGP